MIVRVVTPPEPIVTWAEAQRHLRLDGEDEKAYVEALIAAATAWIDGPGGWLGRAIGVQVLELIDCAFGINALPYQPIREIISVVYLNSSRSLVTIPPADYRLLLNGSISPSPTASWPAVVGDSEAVRIQYEAGYATVPSSIKQAILLLIAHWFENRESVALGATVEQLPFGVEALLAPYRVWRL